MWRRRVSSLAIWVVLYHNVECVVKSNTACLLLEMVNIAWKYKSSGQTWLGFNKHQPEPLHWIIVAILTWKSISAYLAHHCCEWIKCWRHLCECVILLTARCNTSREARRSVSHTWPQTIPITYFCCNGDSLFSITAILVRNKRNDVFTEASFLLLFCFLVITAKVHFLSSRFR